ncbi:hypothetical protein [Roseomonas populi]|uniref:Uncharacterized protein n=1 Tax=Roseomonas populi TaxID=3121582 RepID=A0ABT1WXS8_9PROT|nr:hypothetical protein [Roseomonas pecuniae]MCR0980646.1 hypothetical protein [Roseomonas pecuniae]
MRYVTLALLLGLTACAVQDDTIPPVPPLAGQGTRSPVFNAIQGAAMAFANPAALAGRPAEAAIAVSRLEWEAAAIPVERSFFWFSTITGPALTAARYEVRQALGIRQDARPALVMGAMDSAAAALIAGDQQGARGMLSPPTFAPDTLERLANLPRLPQANQATLRAQRDIEFGRTEDWDLP